MLVRTDAAGATKEFAAHLTAQGEFSVGASRALDIHTAPRLPRRVDPGLSSPQAPRRRAGVQIEPRDGAWVAEATGLVCLTWWPPGTRLILRKERPHPGAQLRITDADGHCGSPGSSPTPPRRTRTQLADLELRHRRHARVEDRIRAAKDTGMRNLPFHDTDQNRIWVAIAMLAVAQRPHRIPSALIVSITVAVVAARGIRDLHVRHTFVPGRPEPADLPS